MDIDQAVLSSPLSWQMLSRNHLADLLRHRLNDNSPFITVIVQDDLVPRKVVFSILDAACGRGDQAMIDSVRQLGSSCDARWPDLIRSTAVMCDSGCCPVTAFSVRRSPVVCAHLLVALKAMLAFVDSPDADQMMVFDDSYLMVLASPSKTARIRSLAFQLARTGRHRDN